MTLRTDKLIVLGRSGGSGFSRKEDIQSLWDMQEGLCYFCAMSLVVDGARIEFDVDHLEPLCHGGTNWPDNLALTCRPCNAKKHFRTERQYWNVLKKERGVDWVAKQRKRVAAIRQSRKALATARLAERWDALVEFQSKLTADVWTWLGLDAGTDAIPPIRLEEHWGAKSIGPMSRQDVWIMQVRLGRRSTSIDLPPGGRRSIKIWYGKNRDALVESIAEMVT